MIAALVCLLQAPLSASDFFPIAAGWVWTYEVKSGPNRSMQRAESGVGIKIGEAQAVPLKTFLDEEPAGTSYYQVEGDTVYLIAEDPKKPFKAGLPIVKADEKSTWDFGGEIVVMGEKDRVMLKGEVQLLKDRKTIFGKRDTLQVKLDMLTGSGPLAIRMKQTAYYARGLGLVEMTSEQQMGTKKSTTSLKLVQAVSPPDKQ